nr:IclR family transcriptional regulator [Pseudomonas sp.]
SMKVRQAARPLMEQIARETGCTVNLGMRDRLKVVYVDTCRVDQGNIFQPDIGSTRPLLSSSIGRALLLAASSAERTAILNRLKVSEPEEYATQLPNLAKDEKAFASRGYCYSCGDWRREIHAVAVPIRQAPGEECLALNATMSAFRLKDDTLQREVAPRLREAALAIEHASGVYS